MLPKKLHKIKLEDASYTHIIYFFQHLNSSSLSRFRGKEFSFTVTFIIMLSLKTNQKSLFKQSNGIMYRLGSAKYRLNIG